MYGPVSQPGTFSRFPFSGILIKDMLEGPNQLDLREDHFVPPIRDSRTQCLVCKGVFRVKLS